LQTKVGTLKDQLAKFTGSDNISFDKLRQKLMEAEDKLAKAVAHNVGRDDWQSTIQAGKDAENHIRNEIQKKKELVTFLMEQLHNSTCDSCGQELTDEAKQTMREKTQKRLDSVKQEGKDLVQELAHVQQQNKHYAEQGEKFEALDVEPFEQEFYRLKSILSNSEHIQRMVSETEEAENELETVKKERLESMKIVETIKVFVEKKAEIQVNQVNELFDSLSVQLFEKQKNGDLKQKFEIEWNGKPFSKLSTAEKIRAGLELIKVIQEQSGVEGPTFVDNAESVIGLEPIPGQFIKATVKDTELTIKSNGGEE